MFKFVCVFPPKLEFHFFRLSLAVTNSKCERKVKYFPEEINK